VAKRRREPAWLTRLVIDAIHADQLRTHGGLAGVRDENALESALARPRQKWTHGERDLAVLAAAYGFGLVRNHPYRDGNKRIGFLAMVTFLGLNDHDLTTGDSDVVTTIVALAAGRLGEPELVETVRRWIS
jgi:death on curing protein